MLKVNRSTLYYKPRTTDDEDEIIEKEIRKIHEKHPYLGGRKLKVLLVEEGFKCNKKKVERIMQKYGIQALQPKKKTSIGSKQHKKYPYLLHDLAITYPNQA